ncbi:MAG: hypothetical protein NT154_03010 [Verrucomicrobia bacterium]|nr:hypothetical protein [Verrucomicrobiota bacterium]
MKLRPLYSTAAGEDSPPPEYSVAGLVREWSAVLALAVFMGMAFVAISCRSFWIDEVATAVQAMQPTLGSWWQVLAGEKSAHLQMPLYMLYMWGYEKLLGSSEWTLRVANLPWFLAGAVAFTLAFPAGDRRRLIAACMVLLCPFAWYYLDEARPYAMQIGASLLVVGSVVRLSEGYGEARPGDRFNLAQFLFGLVALSGNSLTGMIWAGAGLAALPILLSRPRLFGLLKRHVPLLLVGGGLLSLLAGYYLWTLTVGARASAAATTTWGSVLFVGYELLGFGGLGPGRLELRTAGPAALRGNWEWLALYGVIVAIVIGAAVLHEIRGSNRRHLVLVLACGVPAAFILGVGFVAHFRVLGRHFAPLIPVLLLLFTSGLDVLWSRKSAWAGGVAVLFCVLSLASSLFLRFSQRHEKDNYRAAAAMARTALENGQLVWWNAAPEGAQYYGVSMTPRPGGVGAALLVLNPTPETLKNLPAPYMIVASKPDLYDSQSCLSDYVQSHGYRTAGKFNAFVIWARGDN